MSTCVTRPACSGLCPGGSLKSPSLKTAQLLWATCCNVWLLSWLKKKKRFFLISSQYLVLFQFICCLSCSCHALLWRTWLLLHNLLRGTVSLLLHPTWGHLFSRIKRPISSHGKRSSLQQSRWPSGELTLVCQCPSCTAEPRTGLGLECWVEVA